MSDLFRQARQTLEEGSAARAKALFDSLLVEAPAWIDSRYGAAAYWNGVAVGQLKGAEAAAQVWRQGLDAIRGRRGFDIRLADAYLGYLMRDEVRLDREMPLAVDLYVNLLNNADAVLEADERDRIGMHLAQLAPVLPPDVLEETIRGGPELVAALRRLDGLDSPEYPDTDSWWASKGAGPQLVKWWRSRDPLPATRDNERIREHLARVGFALREYPDPASPDRVDARGRIHIRYGLPQEQIEISFDDPVLTDIVYRPGVAVSMTDFPDNEFWVYGQIDRAGWYLFVRERGRYRLAETEDLIPNTLRFGFSAGERGRIKAGMTIAVMQNIFRQLAPLHPDFAIRYAEVDAYAMQLPEFAAGRMASRSSRPVSGALGGIQGGTQLERPDRFAQSMMVKSRTEDDASLQRRDDTMPRDFSQTAAERGTLEVGWRAIRYLDPDGSTRTDIVWAPKPGGLNPGRAERKILESMAYPDTGNYLLSVTAVRQDSSFFDDVVVRDRVLLENLPSRNEAIATQTISVPGSEDFAAVSLQWDQFAMPRRGSQAGPALRVATARADSLAPLSTDPGKLEMSDLLPLVAPLEAVEAGAEPEPYPFRELTRDQQLGLSFEIYHLNFGADDHTRYTVSFQVDRERERGGLLSLRPGASDRTGARFSGTGTSRIAKETILIDLQDWQGTGVLEMRVTVTDETSGQSADRTINFDLR